MNKNLILISIAILLMGLLMGKSIAQAPGLSFVITAAIAIGLATLINTDIALAILIFSMLFSPEFQVAEAPGRGVVVRIDDILLIVVFCTWIAKMAINKQLGLLRYTSLNRPIIVYILACFAATIIGLFFGDIHYPLKSSFFLLKYIEYFMLFFMVTNNIRSKRQIKVFIILILVTCAVVCVYTLTQIGVQERLTAPFEGKHGEPNTLGGYLLLLFAVSIGLFLYARSSTWRFWSAALICLIIPPFLFSLSRGSYVGFIAMYLWLIVLTARKRMFLIIILLLAIPLLPAALPKRVADRITETFVPGKVYNPLGERITLDESAAARIETWRRIMKKWKSRPLFGYGVTGLGLIDSQFTRVLGETGLIGMSAFIWFLISIFRTSLQTFKTVKDDWAKGLTLGFLVGFVGLLFHSISASTFIIVRIMEPFWFLAAIVIMLPELEVSSQEEVQPQQI